MKSSADQSVPPMTTAPPPHRRTRREKRRAGGEAIVGPTIGPAVSLRPRGGILSAAARSARVAGDPRVTRRPRDGPRARRVSLRAMTECHRDGRAGRRGRSRHGPREDRRFRGCRGRHDRRGRAWRDAGFRARERGLCRRFRRGRTGRLRDVAGNRAGAARGPGCRDRDRRHADGGSGPLPGGLPLADRPRQAKGNGDKHEINRAQDDDEPRSLSRSHAIQMLPSRKPARRVGGSA